MVGAPEVLLVDDVVLSTGDPWQWRAVVFVNREAIDEEGKLPVLRRVVQDGEAVAAREEREVRGGHRDSIEDGVAHVAQSGAARKERDEKHEESDLHKADIHRRILSGERVGCRSSGLHYSTKIINLSISTARIQI